MKPKSPKPIRVVLADDHPIVRGGISQALRELPGVELVGEANDGREAIDLAKSAHPNLILMDISMPGLNGLEATERIVKACPQSHVIILSRHDDDQYVWRALKVGARGYVLKKAVIAELKVAVQRVAGGEIYLSREIETRLRNQLPLHQIAHARSPVEQLSARQREILQLIAEGQTTKAIALTLKVSPKTVEYHRAKLMQRLNIFDIPGLVRFALKTGLASQES
ncbi:MAG TPA: response regulator transcription factor [Candidatus Paceibacterota bacterium]|nr:response regulator transcription factor [Verrucomicrobiota bacterium]HSA12999.1 response regulator transcription factor [Candidatus Paceibacterota bacterium]